ncbi:MAG TPA: hypothetical protein VJN96_10660, partial [Vicinamibacterales bacterium]|nr:hypothetical protein [Vicinamibacterales bacterium]
MRNLILTVSLVVLVNSGVASGRQTAAAVVSTTGVIPRAGFKSWSLFLVCNPDWASPEKSGDLADLYYRFARFGDAIGDDNLAVWFWKREVPVSDPKLSENVDVARSAQFCRAIERPPSQGPYLVVTNAYPDVKAFPKERAIFELGGLPPAELSKLLNKLTDQLLLQRRIDPSVVAPPP